MLWEHIQPLNLACSRGTTGPSELQKDDQIMLMSLVWIVGPAKGRN